MDARRVAGLLGIAHYVLNYEDRFQKSVIGDFAASYLAGETPVPCVRCNQTVKFSDLLKTARELGASALVTGHYVRSRPGPEGWEMYQAISPARDQSYFLFATPGSSSITCASRWARLRRAGPGRSRRAWACPWRINPIVRISVSFLLAITRASSASCAQRAESLARSCMPMALCLGSIGVS